MVLPAFAGFGFTFFVFTGLVLRIFLHLFLFVSHSLIEPKKRKTGQHKEPVTVGNAIINRLMNADHKSDDHDGKQNNIKKSQPNLHVKSGLPALIWCTKKNPVWPLAPFLSESGLEL